MRFILFLLVLNLVLVALNVRAYRWLTQAFALSLTQKRWLIGTLAVSLIVSGGGRMASRAGYDLPFEWPLVVAFAVQLTVIMSVVLLFVVDVARLLLRAAAGVRGIIALRAEVSPTSEVAEVNGSAAEREASVRGSDEDIPNSGIQQPEPKPEAVSPTAAEPATASNVLTRRDFGLQLVVGSTFLVGGTSSVYGSLVGRHDYVVEEVPVRIPGLKRALDGFSIVQLSDIHIGQFVGEHELRAAEELVRQAKPDLIVLTGDLIDHDPRFAPTLGRFVRRLSPLAKQGVFVISGNHDYYAGIEPTLSSVATGGGHVLENRGLVIGDADAGFALLGVNDVRASRFHPSAGPDLARAVQSLPRLAGRVSRARDMPRVLLCHNPVYFEEAQHQVALQLSGHTHGGQVNLGIRPADWVLPNGWVAGLYSEGGSQLYVNRGFGTVGPPARVGAAPEVSRIVLTV